MQTAQAQVQAASRQMTQAMASIGPGATQAQGGVNNLAQGLQQLGGAFGIAFGAAGVAQLGRFAVEADAVATAYRRQSVAAANLAGGQAKLNSLLATYEQATGGAVSQAESLQNVTKLMSVGFADNAAELDKFARSIRGISIAMGASQDTVTQNLILELFTQRGARLDQLGLQYDKVRQRSEELRAADSSLTQQMAYQQAVLEQAEQRFGALADSAEGQATEVEKLRKAWADLRLEIGQGGAVDAFAKSANDQLQEVRDVVQGLTRDLENLGKIAANNMPGGGSGFQTFFINDDPLGDAIDQLDQMVADWLARMAGQLTQGEQAAMDRSVARYEQLGRRNTSSLPGAPPRFTTEQNDAIAEWHKGTLEIERQAARDRLDATRQYEEQRTTTIRQYEQTIAREAADFARSRARSEQDYAIGLQRMHRDIAEREARQFEDLERTISEARLDAAERATERQIAYEERVAETRADSAERIAEMEADFAKTRERAQRDHADRLRDAAANLDAVAVREAQRDFRNSQKDTQEDHTERIQKERANEAKRLDELNKAHAKQTADEAKALQKRIDDANTAYQRQLEDARAADEQRLTDMSADFQLRKEREDEDRGIRLERMREDHEAQLGEMAAQHENRLIQISDHAQQERDRLNTEFGHSLEALGVYVDAFITESERATTQAIAEFDRWLAHVNAAFMGATQGPQPLNPLITPGGWPSLGGAVAPVPSSVTNSSNRALTLAPGAIVINGDGLNEQQVAAVVISELANFFEG
ncbi:MAG: hypothetical protein ACTS5I_03330 [Rhodanobacter sp.]